MVASLHRGIVALWHCGIASYDPEHCFYELLGHQDQANHIADYWRSFYHVPLRNTNSAAVHTLFTDPPAAPPQPPPSSMATEGRVDESSWPATELSEDERISLQHCLLKLGTPIPASPSHAARDS